MLLLEYLQATMTIFLAVLGAAFMLLAAVGILVMNDLYTRMQAASKAATLGAACCLLACAVHFATADIAVRALLAAGFLFFTAPVAAHMIARAAYLARTPLAPETEFDDLRGCYDPKSHALRCPENLNAPAADTTVPADAAQRPSDAPAPPDRAPTDRA